MHQIRQGLLWWIASDERRTMPHRANDKIEHCGTEYPLVHLKQSFGIVRWNCQDGTNSKFSVRVNYAPHCYSDASLPRSPGSFVFVDRGEERVFCPDRHAWSYSVPAMVANMLHTPTVKVGLTGEGNWSQYCLYMNPPLPNGKLYYVFFRLYRTNAKVRGTAIPIDMHIESAYARKAVGTVRQAPFGRALELAKY